VPGRARPPHRAATGHRTYQIGDVTERVGLSLRTVRYYEEVELVVPSDRTAGGFRLYAESDIERLIMARELKPLGFSLDELREMLDLIEAQERGAGLTSAQRATLSEYSARATERYDKLRDQLAAADRIARRMRRAPEDGAKRGVGSGRSGARRR
jgi:DNA-binding transcriptional MerR regulator